MQRSSTTFAVGQFLRTTREPKENIMTIHLPLPKTIASTFELLANTVAARGVKPIPFELDIMPEDERLRRFSQRGGIDGPAYVVTVGMAKIGLYDTNDVHAFADYVS